MAEKKPRLLMLVNAPIEERLQQVQKRLQTHAELEGPDASSVRTGRWIIAEIEDAMHEAEEAWLPTTEASNATGWDEQTLTKWARRKLRKEPVPHDWRGIQVRKSGAGYAFRVSTLPVKPKKKRSA